MANELDWLEVEIRTAYEAAESIHNEPMRERYQAWLAMLIKSRGKSTNALSANELEKSRARIAKPEKIEIKALKEVCKPYFIADQVANSHLSQHAGDELYKRANEELDRLILRIAELEKAEEERKVK